MLCRAHPSPACPLPTPRALLLPCTHRGVHGRGCHGCRLGVAAHGGGCAVAAARVSMRGRTSASRAVLNRVPLRSLQRAVSQQCAARALHTDILCPTDNASRGPPTVAIRDTARTGITAVLLPTGLPLPPLNTARHRTLYCLYHSCASDSTAFTQSRCPALNPGPLVRRPAAGRGPSRRPPPVRL